MNVTELQKDSGKNKLKGVKMKPLKRLERKLVRKGAIIDLYCDTVEDENGFVQNYDFIKHKGAAAVVPVTEDGKILMVKQYRNALDRFTLELPAGGLNSEDEPMIQCAARELEEETGYRSDNLQPLISLRTTVAFCNEKIQIFHARELKKSHQNLDEGEFIEPLSFTIDELMDKIYSFEIEDAKTIAGLMAYRTKYCTEK